MKNRSLFLLCFAIFGQFLGVNAQPAAHTETAFPFADISWQQAQTLAKAQDKLIFAVLYDASCGHCANLMNKILPNDSVRQLLSERFIPIKVEIHTQEPALLRKIPVPSAPVVCFLGTDTSIFYRHNGAANVSALYAITQAVLHYAENTRRMVQSPNDSALLRQWAMVEQFRNPDNATVVTLRYLAKLPSSTFASPSVWAIIRNGVRRNDNAVFRYAIAHSDTFMARYKGAFLGYCSQLLDGQMQRAIDDRNFALVDTFKQCTRKILEGSGMGHKPLYDEEADIRYYKGINDKKMYIEKLIHYIETYQYDNWRILARRSMDIAQDYSEIPVLETALKWATRAQQLEDNYITLYTLSFAQFRLNRLSEAEVSAQKALVKCDQAAEKERLIDFIKQIQSYR